jgi:hypothetical protein
MGQMFSPDGPWPRYQLRVGYKSSRDRSNKLLAAFDVQAPNDDAAESIARRLATALCGDSGWGSCYELERLP